MVATQPGAIRVLHERASLLTMRPLLAWQLARLEQRLEARLVDERHARRLGLGELRGARLAPDDEGVGLRRDRRGRPAAARGDRRLCLLAGVALEGAGDHDGAALERPRERRRAARAARGEVHPGGAQLVEQALRAI